VSAPAGERGAPPVSAVVVSWNSERFLEDCLRSLFDQRGVAMEVLVVDNGSTDGSVALVKQRYPAARLVELRENKGFCAANNAGLAMARGAYVLFANSDIILEADFAEKALAAFAKDARVGSVAGKLLRFDRRTIDSAGQLLTRSRRIVERGYGGPDGPRFSAEGYIFSVCGAALFCRREMIEDISVDGLFFDESYFAFSEDLDVGWRARLAGWRAWYAPGAVAYHYRGGSENEEGGARALPALLRRPSDLRFHILKNRWLTLLKNDSIACLLRDLPFIASRDLLLLAATAVSAPGILLRLAGSGPLWRKAVASRRAFFSRRGAFGLRRPGARTNWVRWTDPSAEEPDPR
jgi:GT2 family glycosyltransferase